MLRDPERLSRQLLPGLQRRGVQLRLHLYAGIEGGPQHPERGGLPYHIAVIPDGNRRWARLRGLPPQAGHARGFLEVTPQLLEAIWDRDIPETTLWLFSTDNWSRSAAEVAHLMEVYRRLLEGLGPRLLDRRVRLRPMGRRDRIPPELRVILECLEERTRALGPLTLNLALDYGGKEEVAAAVRKLVADGIPAERVDYPFLRGYLSPEKDGPTDPDLIIRTSGEMRLSGFMPLQSMHSEFYFTETLYPDFDEDALDRALDAYQARERRFGG